MASLGESPGDVRSGARPGEVSSGARPGEVGSGARPGEGPPGDARALVTPSAGLQLREALGTAGRIGGDLLDVDWSATGVGPIEGWPRSLSTVVRTMVGSRFSMWMAWGPSLTFFCNDAYRRDTLGTKYPWALGRPAWDVWAEIWPDIGPRIEQVINTGIATWDEALQLFLERSGYVEETYHTFSYSPLTDDDGHISGMLCVVSEDTGRVIGERRMRTLRDLGAGMTTTHSEAEVLDVAGQQLAANPQDLPFVLTYLCDDDGLCRLASRVGLPPGHPAAPDVLRPDVPHQAWPTPARGSQTVPGLRQHFPTLPTEAWADPPDQALVVPMTQQGGAQPTGYLVAGLNPYRPLDESYRGFVELIAGQLVAGVAAARAYEAERHRAESLAALDRAKTNFFTNVSHEFRTPLTLMLSPAEDALADLRQPLPAVHRQRVELMHRNALRLLKLVNTLLDFSRLESGRAAARFQPTDLARRTADLAALFAPAVERAGLSFEIDCPPLPAPVHVDREMWAKIVLNLLSNALKFTFSGRIGIRLRQRGDVAELIVTDTGVGIEPAEQPRLFERFHRVSGTRSRSYEGSGIGLALVGELAGAHGGTAGVTSVPGEGSRFTVTVPLGTDHLPAGQLTSGDQAAADDVTDLSVSQQAESFLAEAMRWVRGEAPEAAGGDVPVPAGATRAGGTAGPAGAVRDGDPVRDGAPVQDGGRRRVLVADDNADMRDYLVALLSDSYEVAAAPDGAEALRLAATDPPDLVLTDVMMPHLDGFGLLRELRTNPVTALVPVVMLSARAGSEAATGGLDAGADDYLVKPFSARELRARVRSNLELDRTRRASLELERSRRLLDQAQRLAGVGSWELDLGTGAVTASEEFVRQVGIDREQLRDGGVDQLLQMLHPDDRPLAQDAIRISRETGTPLDLEVRWHGQGGEERVFRARGELDRDTEGHPARLRGSNQDVTEQRRAERALAAAAAAREAAAREHRIADELQRSLLPAPTFTPDHLKISTYYRAGVEGTEVGGDWFDVIELGANRAALVMGDVMGRGVRAAAVMGQLRAAVRAYARLDLPPADLLELMDGVVRDLGEDQIVTCVYAVYDPGDRSLTYANAGHLPPLMARPGQPAERLTGAAGPPLGTGPLGLVEERVELPVGGLLALYTDGLVEQRDRDIDTGIDLLTERLASLTGTDADDVPHALVADLVAGVPDDDIAVLVVHVPGEAPGPDVVTHAVPPRDQAVAEARHVVTATLGRWEVPQRRVEDIVLVVSELVTNAVLHGQPPVELRLHRTPSHVVVEVHDGASILPRPQRPTPDDEHGRGLLLVAILAERWGTRPTVTGKSVWCVVST